MATENLGRIVAEVVTPSHALYEGPVDEVIAKSGSGLMTILPNHLPALLDLTMAPLVLKSAVLDERVFVIESGFLEFKNNTLTILVDQGREVADRDEANAICGTKI
ncbi:hypothetical protein [Stomatohabitans albus]|uniref:F0F1 ATP synthase subunit epsilon n=1 Tax=Stomatohabitans albus TaxID=3110766 RepID=UPI00300C500E